MTDQLLNALRSPTVVKVIVDAIYNAVYEKIANELHDSLQVDINSKMSQIHELDEHVKTLKKNIVDINEAIDEQEQYSRRNCLKFHGVPETADENTDTVIIDLVKDKMGIELDPIDIDRSHRINQRTPRDSNGRYPPKVIIVKFTRYNQRDKVYRARVKLRRTNIYVHEDLTAIRSRLLYKARIHDNVKKTWTLHGRITALVEDGRKISIRSEKDIEKL